MPGILLCCLVCQALKGAPWVGSYSVIQCIRHLMGQPLLFSCGCWLCGEREAMVMAPPPVSDSAVPPYFHGCLTFLHRHFPPQSPPSHPLDPSLCSQQQPLPWDCSTIPKLQLPAAVPSRRPAPQSLNSSCQLPCLLGDLHRCLGYVWLWKRLSDSHSI